MNENTSLAERVTDLLHAPKTEQASTKGALRRAEELADRYSDIKPQAAAMPVERYFGSPFALASDMDGSVRIVRRNQSEVRKPRFG